MILFVNGFEDMINKNIWKITEIFPFLSKTKNIVKYFESQYFCVEVLSCDICMGVSSIYRSIQSLSSKYTKYSFTVIYRIATIFAQEQIRGVSSNKLCVYNLQVNGSASLEQ